MLTDDDILRIKIRLEQAFLPLICDVNVFDLDDRLSFRVTDQSGKGLIAMPMLVLHVFVDVTALEELIQAAKECLRTKGFIPNDDQVLRRSTNS